MKKVLALVTTIAMALSLVACGNEKKSDSKNETGKKGSGVEEIKANIEYDANSNVEEILKQSANDNESKSETQNESNAAE